jgi:hypothetical protein
MRSGPLVRGGRREAGIKMGDKARERLRAAHAQAKAGDHAGAAAELRELAGIARKRGLHRIAVHLGTRSAAQAAKAGDRDAVVAATADAIADAKLDGDKPRSARAFGRVLKALRAGDHEEAAERVAAKVRSELGVAAKAPSGDGPPVNRAMRRHLPKTCPTCGDKVGADSVDFNDDGSVDCGTCGGVLKG